MSNEPDQKNESLPEDVLLDRIVSKDWALEVLLNAVFGRQDEGGEFGLTVHTNGLIVSGLAVGFPEWARLTAEQLRANAPDPEFASTIESVWMESFKNIHEEQDQREEQGLPRFRRHYIHMRDAMVLTSTGSVDMATWRGRLDDVTGWHFGAYKNVEAQ